MFISVLSGAMIAIALVAQADDQMQVVVVDGLDAADGGPLRRSSA